MSIDTGPAPILAVTRPSSRSTGYFTEAEIAELVGSGEIAGDLADLLAEVTS